MNAYENSGLCRYYKIVITDTCYCAVHPNSSDRLFDVDVRSMMSVFSTNDEATSNVDTKIFFFGHNASETELKSHTFPPDKERKKEEEAGVGLEEGEQQLLQWLIYGGRSCPYHFSRLALSRSNDRCHPQWPNIKLSCPPRISRDRIGNGNGHFPSNQHNFCLRTSLVFPSGCCGQLRLIYRPLPRGLVLSALTNAVAYYSAPHRWEIKDSFHPVIVCSFGYHRVVWPLILLRLHNVFYSRNKWKSFYKRLIVFRQVCGSLMEPTYYEYHPLLLEGKKTFNCDSFQAIASPSFVLIVDPIKAPFSLLHEKRKVDTS
ncbi:hypothetical protein CDAR_105151 [Caerostris darwini]|uniref:Uncharacterized protein n=1 Tax=Caerostris darwini TaxID=1538125 RepID=A0AAV4V526_9ARAC|nr:hypothetical protein CDAR_105151 [Caerostris darwini]